jgi:hypothetical protein
MREVVKHAESVGAAALRAGVVPPVGQVRRDAADGRDDLRPLSRGGRTNVFEVVFGHPVSAHDKFLFFIGQ